MIVRTLLDTDLYKFTTSYAYIKLFPYAIAGLSRKRSPINFSNFIVCLLFVCINRR